MAFIEVSPHVKINPRMAGCIQAKILRRKGSSQTFLNLRIPARLIDFDTQKTAALALGNGPDLGKLRVSFPGPFQLMALGITRPGMQRQNYSLRFEAAWLQRVNTKGHAVCDFFKDASGAFIISLPPIFRPPSSDAATPPAAAAAIAQPGPARSAFSMTDHVEQVRKPGEPARMRV